MEWSINEPAALADYNEYATVYDYVFSDADEDGPYWRNEAAGRSVLEVGCGTGRITEMLVESTRVVGVDPSAGMLRLARERSAGAAEYVEGGLSELPFSDSEFEQIICPRGAFSHVVSLDEQLQAARELARVVAPQGRVTVDVPRYDIRRFRQSGRTQFSTRKRVGDASVRIDTESTYGPLYGVIEHTESISIKTSSTKQLVNLHMLAKVFTPTELISILLGAGLRFEAICGDYDGSPLTETSPRMIAKVTKPAL